MINKKNTLGSNKRLKVVGVIAAVVAVLVAVVIGIIALQPKPAPLNAPPFDALLPANKSIEQLGGWNKLTPPNTDPAYVFSDAIGAISITVSQQVLPTSFTANPGQSLTDLAKAYSATEQIEVDGTKVYIGTSSKGPQSVLFVKNNLLVLIKSQARVTNDAWDTYIRLLR